MTSTSSPSATSCQTGLARATWACSTPSRPSSAFSRNGMWLASSPLLPWVTRVPNGYCAISAWRTSVCGSSKSVGTYIAAPAATRDRPAHTRLDGGQAPHCVPAPAGPVAPRHAHGLGPAGVSGRIRIRLIDEDQHAQDRQVNAERRLEAVPCARLPHQEPFAAHHHEAEEPQQEAQRGPRVDQRLGAPERLGRQTPRTPHRNAPSRNSAPITASHTMISQ